MNDGVEERAMRQLAMPEDYWENFQITERDIEILYNHLLEIETPQTTQELLGVLIAERIRLEKKAMEKKLGTGPAVYTPERIYSPGDSIILPAFNWIQAKVVSKRTGQNPAFPDMQVIEVEMDGGERRELASNLASHKLNEPISFDPDDPYAQPETVIKQYGKKLTILLEDVLVTKEDLVRIAGRWFPRSLLIDVNIGHLNLAEAILEMADGGPLSTESLIEQIDLPTDSNPKLTEFSLNLALQEDPRFDEVGPSGETLWFLHRLEPEGVKNIPVYLRWSDPEYAHESVEGLSHQFSREVCDELEPEHEISEEVTEFSLALIYPHWRAGTLPLSQHIIHLFPTAYEAPRIRFLFIDKDNGKQFPGWVVRPGRYVYGLREWYEEAGLIPGSIVHLQKGKQPGEVIVFAERHRPTREWIRTGLIGTDGGIVFTEQKQNCTAKFNDRLAIYLSDTTALDKTWEQGSRSHLPMDKLMHDMMIDIARLKPQGQVHAEELYAVINLVRRCPPRMILSVLMNASWAVHLGDLYFRLNDGGSVGDLYG